MNAYGGTPTPILQAFSMDYQNEFQIHGTLDTALGATPGVTWVVGLYASGAPNGPGPTSPNIPMSFNGAYNINEGPYPSYWSQSYWSAYWAEYFNTTIDAGMFWKPLTGLQVSGGVRQSQNYTSDYYYTITAHYNNPAYPNIYSAGPPLYPSVSRSNPLNWQWSVSYVTNDNNIYVSNAYIVVPGYNNTPLPASVTASEVPGYVSVVNPENLLDYEAGDKYKLNFGGVRGYIDLDLYHETLSNVQLGETTYVQSIATYVGFTSNPANEEKDGVELQGEIFPTQNLDIYANFSYAHDFYTSYLSSDPTGYAQSYFVGDVLPASLGGGAAGNSPLCVAGASLATIPAALRTTNGSEGTCIMNFKSSPLPFAPDVQASIRLNYTIPLEGNLGNLVYNFTANYTSYEYEAGGYEDLPLLREEEILGPGVKASESSPEHTLVNMRLTWNEPMGQKNVTAALWVTNLTNITVPTGSLDFLFATAVATQDFGPPRQFGFEISAKW